ncbi:MAG: T9SS type A sorting domain-containing protein [Ignavibacteria bacterium]|nr:T9SS type A sorting domain-containing protein [Ignavibacteria bacterium]
MAIMFIVWDDDRNNSASDIYHKWSLDGGLTWQPDTRITTTPTLWRDFASIAISGSTLHVIWEDTRQGDGWEIYYMKNENGNPIGISSSNTEIPKKFVLQQNYPNPFNPETNIDFSIPESDFTKLSIYDRLGRELTVLVEQNLKAGNYHIKWDGTKYPSGIYFYRIQSSQFSDSKKMIMGK